MTYSCFYSCPTAMHPAVDCGMLLEYGRRISSHGAVHIIFDKRSREFIAKEVGTKILRQL